MILLCLKFTSSFWLARLSLGQMNRRFIFSFSLISRGGFAFGFYSLLFFRWYTEKFNSVCHCLQRVESAAKPKTKKLWNTINCWRKKNGMVVGKNKKKEWNRGESLCYGTTQLNLRVFLSSLLLLDSFVSLPATRTFTVSVLLEIITSQSTQKKNILQAPRTRRHRHKFFGWNAKQCQVVVDLATKWAK